MGNSAHFEDKTVQEVDSLDVCLNCERMRAARRRSAEEHGRMRMSYGGRRPGAGRKPTTLKGILKKLPKEAAVLLERELKAKAELILVGIKLEMLTKAKVAKERARESPPAIKRETERQPFQRAGDPSVIESMAESTDKSETQ